MEQNKFQAELPVIIIREVDQYVAYTPVLELCTSGETAEEAKKNFDEIVTVFFEEVIERGTLAEVLSGLGWEEVDHEWVPPEVVSQVSEQFTIPVQ